ncbi:MAG: GNAT family N-acetyltransferase [Peptococcaceae bacterium]|nr:GNAT family N-acetyltransferase [Peptococcaceae bacterium]
MNIDLKNIMIEAKIDMPLRMFKPSDIIPRYLINALYYEDLDLDKKTNIGSASAILLDPYFCEDISLSAACDSYSRELADLVTDIYNKEESFFRPPLNSLISSTVLFLEYLIVEPKYQNKQIGTTIVEWIIKYICRDLGAIVLNPKPMERICFEGGLNKILYSDKSTNNIEKIKGFYSKKGFEDLLGTDYMYRVAEWHGETDIFYDGSI